jgi:hypothetical protein
MTIPRLNAIMTDLGKVPPRYMSAAAAAGYDLKKATESAPQKAKTNEEKVTELMAIFPVFGA